MNSSTEKAIFAAGCFWGVQEEFDKLPGVISTRVGYIGGRMKDPTYDDVCTDTTEHAEAIEITFNPEEISYSQLLEAFWGMHDPTQLNKQGNDFGKQYRGAIFISINTKRKLPSTQWTQSKSTTKKK